MAAFVRQLGHDIRNDLNALSLEAALLKELVADPEAVTSASRIQTQLRDIANRLKDLSGRYALPAAAQPSPISVAELATHLQNGQGAEGLEWQPVTAQGQVLTDAALLGRAFRELAQNALDHTGLKKPQAQIVAGTAGGAATLVLRESHGDDFKWPESAFETLRAGRYGAGIPIAMGILRGLGHAVERKREGEFVETRISLQAAPA